MLLERGRERKKSGYMNSSEIPKTTTTTTKTHTHAHNVTERMMTAQNENSIGNVSDHKPDNLWLFVHKNTRKYAKLC